jgi:hypothetical protein
MNISVFTTKQDIEYMETHKEKFVATMGEVMYARLLKLLKDKVAAEEAALDQFGDKL